MIDVVVSCDRRKSALYGFQKIARLCTRHIFCDLPPRSMSKYATLHFIKSGMHTLIQDAGRSGHQREGIPAGGYLDRTSALAANWCAWNPPQTPVLEITLRGPVIRFEGDCQIAITGAEMQVSLNDTDISRYETIDVADGSELVFGSLQSGCRAYLAVHGKWQVPIWLGSASPLVLSQASILPSGIISKGSRITIQIPDQPAGRRRSAEIPAPWPEHLVLHVLPGPEFKMLPAQAMAFFFNTTFTVTTESNRMGYRLSPLLPDHFHDQELISSAMIPGTIQLSREGQPVILLADAQTTGGYPRIAHIVQADLDAIAQLRPGGTVEFQIVKR